MIPPNQLEDYEAKVRNNFRQVGQEGMNNSQEIENGILIMNNY